MKEGVLRQLDWRGREATKTCLEQGAGGGKDLERL